MVEDIRDYGDIQAVTKEKLFVMMCIKLDRLIDISEIQVEILSRDQTDIRSEFALAQLKAYMRRWK